MKRVYSGCVSKIDEKKEPIEGAIDYSELSESILTNQIQSDLAKITAYSEKAHSEFLSGFRSRSYDLIKTAQNYIEEVVDCFEALNKKMREKESKK